MLLTSPRLARLPGVAHGFTTRVGGVSQGPLASLNLALRGDETRERLAENWRRACAAVGMPEARVAVVSQVHGDALLRGDEAAGPLHPLGEADAILVTQPGVLAAVRVADCVPVLLAAPGAVVAVHAGWRGTAKANVLGALEALRAQAGCGAEEVVAAIGPCISGEVYEVSLEVAEAIGEVAPGAIIERQPRPHVDLGLANELMLRRAGVEQVDRLDACTARRSDLFSHRADGPDTGRLAALIGLLP